MKKIFIYLNTIVSLTITSTAFAENNFIGDSETDFNLSSAESDFNLSTADPVTITNQIKTLALNSKCSKYSWTKRGKAPVGYIKGMALSYGRSLCRLKTNPSPLTAILGGADSHNPKKDAISHYAQIFNSRKIATQVSGEEPLRAIYTLGFGLGMRESSGKYCEGWDISAGTNRSSSEAETGLFQFSYNSINASSELRRLYNEYKAHPESCLLSVYKENVTCRKQSILGTGSGADFQVFVKKCPAFAAEYTMTLLRMLRKHFGPINRLEAEVNPDCHNLIQQVTQLIDANTVNACHELLDF